MTLPTLTVRLDDGTGTFPYDITSKVMATDGYGIGRGRDDWQGAVTPGELSLTLNNSDGRFTPGSTILGTPSPIVVDQRIRVIESFAGLGFGLDPFGSGLFGGGSNRFTGYVKSWPVSWPAVVPTFSTVSLTATDAQARAERRPMRSMLEEEVVAKAPTAYYTLGEAEGSTAAGDTSGNRATPLVIGGTGAPVVFGNGTGPGTDGLPAVQFGGGQFLTAANPVVPTSTARSVGVWFNTTQAPAGPVMILFHYGFQINMATSGQLTFSALGNPIGPTAAMNDGHTHFAAIVSDGANYTAYVDGVSVGSNTVGANPQTLAFLVGSDGLGGLGFVGTVSHVVEDPFFSSDDVIAIYNAGAGISEPLANRMVRLASYGDLPLGTVDASTTNITTPQLSGKSLGEAIQETADTELGIAFFDGSGNLTLHGRDRVPSKTVPDLTLTSQWVTPDVQPVTDDQRILNYLEATAGTGAPSLVINTASQTTHGRYADSHTYLVQTDAEALARANWIVAKQAEPATRYGTLTINLYGMTSAQAATVLAALDINCWLRVTGAPGQNPGGTTADVIVQGWREEATGESWTITCNVVARSLYAPVWKLGVSHLGTDTRLYV